MIIDSHVHLDDVMHMKISGEKRVRRLLDAMAKNKVSHSLILADIPFPGEKAEYLTHEQTLKLIGDHPELHLVGKVPLKLAKSSTYLKKVGNYIKAGKMIGIKLYPGYEKFYPQDPVYSKVYDICEEFDVPVMIHSGDVMQEGNLKYARPLFVDELASKRPNLKIIICHMGSPWQLDTAAVTTKNKNVYTDTAGLFYNKLDKGMKLFLERKIEEFVHWNMHGEKLIFGSDWPITDVADTIKLINGIPHFSKRERELIFSKSAKKLFRIK